MTSDDCLWRFIDDAFSERDSFDAVAELLKGMRWKGQLYFIGNGGSAAIASHMAVDFFNKGKFMARSFNDPAALTCIANDYGYQDVFDRQIVRVAKHGDVLMAISSSGESDNILQAVKTAGMICTVVTFTGFKPDNRLRQHGSYNFYVPSENYGIVETAHLGLLHALLEAVSDG